MTIRIVAVAFATLAATACVGSSSAYWSGSQGMSTGGGEPDGTHEMEPTAVSRDEPGPTGAPAPDEPRAVEDLRGRHYDSQGRYAGRVDDNGNKYDASGRYAGRTDSNGNQYDGQGRYSGRTDSSGNHYDAQGRYAGRTDSNGNHYDAQGRYAGRTDSSGNHYDAQGRYAGRVDD